MSYLRFQPDTQLLLLLLLLLTVNYGAVPTAQSWIQPCARLQWQVLWWGEGQSVSWDVAQRPAGFFTMALQHLLPFLLPQLLGAAAALSA